MATTLLAPSRAELEAERCRRSLRHFVTAAWPLIEPGTVFVPNWHIDVICDHLEAVSRREIRRLVINIPPRCMKSVSVAVCWPMWVWLEHPEHQWMFASYAEKLALRDSLKCRRLIETAGIRNAGAGRDLTVLEQIGYQGLLRALHGDDHWQLAVDQNAKGKFENTATGYRLATSVNGTATGEGAHTVVIDDPHKAKEAESDDVRRGVCEWHDSTIPTRFNEPKRSAEVLIMQRLHEEDLTGHLVAKGDWEMLCLPMEYEPAHPFVWPEDPRTEPGQLLWDERIGPDEVATLKRALGAYNSAGQLQQRPAPAEGMMFKRKDFRRYRTLERRVHGQPAQRFYALIQEDGSEKRVDIGTCRTFQSTDVAASDKQMADWTVIATWVLTPDRELVLLDLERQHFDILDVAGFLARKNREQSSPPLWIETFGAGRGPWKSLRKRKLPVMALKHEHGTQLDKVARAWPAIAEFEAHMVYLPRDAEWLGAFESELLSFPNAKNDDQVDVVSYAARLMNTVAVWSPRALAQEDAKAKAAPAMRGVRRQQF